MAGVTQNEDPRPSVGREDWAARYRVDDTPWDLGAAHPELARRLAARGALGSFPDSPASALTPRGSGRALVPGCGRGHDAAALTEAGWRVIAVDAVALRTPALERVVAGGGSYRVEDALSLRLDEPVELVFDHTFFCALQPADRERFGALVRASLAPGGTFCSLLFPHEKPLDTGGPPWGLVLEDYRRVLEPELRVVLDEPVERSVAKRTWPERWVCFERAGGGS